MYNLFWRMLSLSVSYPISFPALIGYALSKNQRYLDVLYKVRSLTHGAPIGKGLRLSKNAGVELLFPSREDPNFEDVYLRNVYFPYLPREDDVVFDVGAHMGFFTVKNAKKVKKIVAFEPDPNNYGFLLENIRRNRLHNVLTFNYAVGKDDGSLFLKRSYGQGRTSVTEKNTGYKVCVKSIDSVAKELNLTPTVIKIDTEGFEIPILQGALSVLARYKPKLLIASYHYPNEAHEVIEYLNARGFVCYRYDVPYTLQWEKETYVYAEPSEKTPLRA
jgi:FkbM family methyltransferase